MGRCVSIGLFWKMERFFLNFCFLSEQKAMLSSLLFNRFILLLQLGLKYPPPSRTKQRCSAGAVFGLLLRPDHSALSYRSVALLPSKAILSYSLVCFSFSRIATKSEKFKVNFHIYWRERIVCDFFGHREPLIEFCTS